MPGWGHHRMARFGLTTARPLLVQATVLGPNLPFTLPLDLPPPDLLSPELPRNERQLLSAS